MTEFEIEAAKREIERVKREKELELYALAKAGKVSRAIRAATELLWGEWSCVGAPYSPTAIHVLHNLWRGGQREAGFVLAHIPHAVLTQAIPIDFETWLSLLVEHAETGDEVAALDLEHMSDAIQQREEVVAALERNRKLRGIA